MSDTLTFLKTFARHPSQVGAIAPSSPALVRAMVESFDWDAADNVVEYGSGTGVFTEAVLESLGPETSFFAIERSPELAAATRARCPGATVYEESVTEVAALCRQEQMAQVDAIVCGLPWASFSESLQEEIVQAMMTVLRPGGRFATFAYWQGLALPAGRRFARRLRDAFGRVERSETVWRNLPPAFVYRCVR